MKTPKKYLPYTHPSAKLGASPLKFSAHPVYYQGGRRLDGIEGRKLYARAAARDLPHVGHHLVFSDFLYDRAANRGVMLTDEIKADLDAFVAEHSSTILDCTFSKFRSLAFNDAAVQTMFILKFY